MGFKLLFPQLANHGLLHGNPEDLEGGGGPLDGVLGLEGLHLIHQGHDEVLQVVC